MLLTDPDLRGIDPADVPDEYHRRGLARLADDELFELAAEVISVPKEAPADSFVLHAPLELLARRALLGLVRADERTGVRHRITWLAATYERAGEPVADPPEDLAVDLAAALTAGDLAAVDTAAAHLAAHGTIADVLALGDLVIPSLAAAAHAPIFLELLPKVAPRNRAALRLLRPLAREVARHAEWRIAWIDDAPLPATVGPGGEPRTEADVVAALLATPLLGRPGSEFIFPLMHQVDSNGVAADVAGAVLRATCDPGTVARALARAASLSMLQDDPGAAPYGWSHCLTMPQAVASLASRSADPRRTLAVAATHLIGFRAGLGAERVGGSWSPEPVLVDPVEALDEAPAVAAAAAWHVTGSRRRALVAAIAARAAAHEDAHLAKYVLACADAASADPSCRRLHLAAAAFLTAWWRGLP